MKYIFQFARLAAFCLAGELEAYASLLETA